MNPTNAEVQIDQMLARVKTQHQSPAGTSTPPMQPTVASYVSPTLESLPEVRRPDPGVICGQCPNAMWFATEDALTCYCRVMHVQVWTTHEPVDILQCDQVVLARASDKRRRLEREEEEIARLVKEEQKREKEAEAKARRERKDAEQRERFAKAELRRQKADARREKREKERESKKVKSADEES